MSSMTAYGLPDVDPRMVMGQPPPLPAAGRAVVTGAAGPMELAPMVASEPRGASSAGAQPVPDASRAAEAAHDPEPAAVRNQVIDRLLTMNIRHAWYAWEHRRSQPVAAHGLAFFYADLVTPRAGHRPEWRVLAATRLVYDGPDVHDPARLIYRLTELARERYVPAPEGLDPRVQLCNRQDAQMSRRAFYIGVGVSSLDTAEASWAQVQRSATSAQQVPGRCFGLVWTDAMLLVHRRAQEYFNEVEVWSTADLNTAPYWAPRPWQPATSDALYTVEGLLPVWIRLRELHTLILTEQERRARTLRADRRR